MKLTNLSISYGFSTERVNTDWLVMCGTNGSSNSTPNNILANGTPVGTSNGGTIPQNSYLTINTGTYPNETLPFQFNCVYIWDTALTNEQLQTMSNFLLNYIKPIIPCFLQGSKILHFDPESNTESYVPVETLRKGDLVKTFMSGYKQVSHIGFTPLNI